MVETVKIDRNSGDDEELYTYWYDCPKCKYKDIAKDDNFCSNCGVKIEWFGEIPDD